MYYNGNGQGFLDLYTLLQYHSLFLNGCQVNELTMYVNENAEYMADIR